MSGGGGPRREANVMHRYSGALPTVHDDTGAMSFQMPRPRGGGVWRGNDASWESDVAATSMSRQHDVEAQASGGYNEPMVGTPPLMAPPSAQPRGVERTEWDIRLARHSAKREPGGGVGSAVVECGRLREDIDGGHGDGVGRVRARGPAR